MSIAEEDGSVVVKASAEVKAPDEKKDETSNVSTAKFSGGGTVEEFDTQWDDDWTGEYLLNKSENQLVARGAFLIQQYQRQRTETLRKLAQVVITLRSKCQYKDMPDWGGNSNKYRELVADMYRRAGVDKDSESSMQKALRYHVGVLLRKVAPAEDLKKLGYEEKNQSQRQTEKAKAGNKAMKGQGKKGSDGKGGDLAEVIDARPKDIPVKGGDDPVKHLHIAMFHLEQASKLTVGDSQADVEKSLKAIAEAALGWLKKMQDKKAETIKDSAQKAEAAVKKVASA